MAIKADHIERFNSAAQGIVEALGTDWKVSRPANHDNPSGLIISDGTRELHFFLPHGCDRVDLSGIFPDGRQAWSYLRGKSVERPRIGFSVTRPAAQIARDIERRFLPEYDRVRVLVAEQVEADTTAQAHQSAALCSVATALGVERRGDAETLSTPGSDRAGYGDFRANHNGTSWEIHLRSVPAAVAVQVAEIIAAARG